MPPSKSEKGFVAELAVDSLTLLLSGGDLHMSRPIPDDADVDRVLVRPHSKRAAFLQIKTRTSLERGRSLHFFFPAPARFEALDRFYLLGTQLMPRSPWLGERFVFVPGRALPKPNRAGTINVKVPVVPGSKTRWAPYIHDLRELATVLSRALDRGPAYPFPPPGGTGPWVKRLTETAAGRIMENEAASAIAMHGGGRLHGWSPLVDDFGHDFCYTDEENEAALRLQPKGAFSLGRRGRFEIVVARRTFRPLPFVFFLFMAYDASKPAGPQYMHVIRADQFEALAAPLKKGLAFDGRPDPSSHDRWRPWLYRVEEVAGVLETALKARIAGEEDLPASRPQVMAARRRLGMARNLKAKR